MFSLLFSHILKLKLPIGVTREIRENYFPVFRHITVLLQHYFGFDFLMQSRGGGGRDSLYNCLCAAHISRIFSISVH